MIQESDPEDADAEFADNLVRMAVDLGVSHKERLTPKLLDAYAARSPPRAGRRRWSGRPGGSTARA